MHFEPDQLQEILQREEHKITRAEYVQNLILIELVARLDAALELLNEFPAVFHDAQIKAMIEAKAKEIEGENRP